MDIRTIRSLKCHIRVKQRRKIVFLSHWVRGCSSLGELFRENEKGGQVLLIFFQTGIINNFCSLNGQLWCYEDDTCIISYCGKYFVSELLRENSLCSLSGVSCFCNLPKWKFVGYKNNLYFNFTRKYVNIRERKYIRKYRPWLTYGTLFTTN